jgi:ferric-dicitrate binding protein FerR (iron transport regulator)
MRDALIMISDIELSLIQRYITADLPATERETMWAWITADPERQRSHDALADLWATSATLGPRVELAPARERFQTFMQGHPVSSRSVAAPRRFTMGSGRAWGGRWAWTAGAAAIVCGVGIATLVGSRSKPVPAETRYATTAGQISHVVVPGGSSMTLAPATSVTVSRGASTTVEVVGEAYFSVTPSSKHPFIVRTSNSVVRVLGTSFSVRRYGSDTRTQVVVEEGKVAVHAERQGIVRSLATPVIAQTVAQVSDSGVSVTPVADTRTLTGWRTGMLVFNDTPVRDVVAEIARCYNAVIRVEGKELANETLILEVAIRRQSLDQVLGIVGLATNAHIRRDGTVFVLVPGRSGVAPHKQRQQQLLPQSEKSYGR